MGRIVASSEIFSFVYRSEQDTSVDVINMVISTSMVSKGKRDAERTDEGVE